MCFSWVLAFLKENMPQTAEYGIWSFKTPKQGENRGVTLWRTVCHGPEKNWILESDGEENAEHPAFLRTMLLFAFPPHSWADGGREGEQLYRYCLVLYFAGETWGNTGWTLTRKWVWGSAALPEDIFNTQCRGSMRNSRARLQKTAEKQPFLPETEKHSLPQSDQLKTSDDSPPSPIA